VAMKLALIAGAISALKQDIYFHCFYFKKFRPL